MTLMLASVTSAAEARTAVAAGADIIDLKDPQAGALGALPVETTRRAVAAVAGARPTSATVGDLPMEPASVRGAVEATAGTGVDYVKVGLFAGPGRLSCLAALAPLCARGIKVVIVIFADQQPDFSLIAPIARSGCAGVMVDTAHKGAGGLIRCLGPNQLKAFVRQARGAGLLTGLARAFDRLGRVVGPGRHFRAPAPGAGLSGLSRRPLPRLGPHRSAFPRGRGGGQGGHPGGPPSAVQHQDLAAVELHRIAAPALVGAGDLGLGDR
jgi:dihydroneopterin aldolase